MCGIYGVFGINKSFSYKDEEIKRVKKVLSGLRGKDYIGFWNDEQKKSYIIHSLLSISGSDITKQPIETSNYIFAFNGEIYSFGNLIKENDINFLEKNINDISDTEKIIYCINKYGLNETLLNINGMYSILLYDKKNKTVEIANDPYEQKPIYFTILNDRLVISSIETLLTKSLTLSKNAIDQAICFGYPISQGSYFQNVSKVKGGYKYTFRFDKNKIYKIESKFFNKFLGFKNKKPDNLIIQNKKYNKLRDSIINSVYKSIKNLKTINVLLSGGIDSTLISSIIIKELKLKVNAFHLTGYSIGDFSDTKRLELTEEILEDLTLFKYKYSNKDYEGFSSSYPGIILNEGFKPLCSILKQIPKDCRVLIGGLGADEIFLGYARHKLNNFKTKRFSYFYNLIRLFGNKKFKNSHSFNFFTFNKLCHFLEIKDPFFKKNAENFVLSIPSNINEETIQEHDLVHSLAKYFNPINDIVGLYYSREIRSPFLDEELINDLKILDFSLKEMEGKRFLKKMLLDYGFTKDWINHKKIGFGPDSNKSIFMWRNNQIFKSYKSN